MGNQIVHFEILGDDAAATKRFYTELFDWKLNEIGGPSEYATVDTGGGEGAIGGGLGGAPEGFEGHVTFYVDVDDVGSALQRAEELGGTSVMGPHRVDGPETGPEPFEIGMFRDPEGRVVGLHSRLD